MNVYSAVVAICVIPLCEFIFLTLQDKKYAVLIDTILYKKGFHLAMNEYQGYRLAQGEEVRVICRDDKELMFRCRSQQSSSKTLCLSNSTSQE